MRCCWRSNASTYVKSVHFHLRFLRYLTGQEVLGSVLLAGYLSGSLLGRPWSCDVQRRWRYQMTGFWRRR